MATLEKAEQLEERLVMSSTQEGVQATLRLTTESTKRLVQSTGSVVKGVGHVAWGAGVAAQRGLSDSLREMAEGIRERAHEQKWGSEIPLEDFAETVDGKREVVSLEDNELVEEVRQELRKHNVTFAVEQDDQDRFYLHVRGNDATLIAHALDRAQERLDARRLEQEPTLEGEEELSHSEESLGADRDADATEQDLSVREEEYLNERREHLQSPEGGELELSDGERAALAQALTEHGDYLTSGTEDLDTRERAAELQADPTYAYNSDLFDQEIEREEAYIVRLQQDASEMAQPFHDLASQVERSGRLDLADPQQRAVVSDALTEHIDAARDGQTLDPALAQITSRLAGTAQPQAAQRRDATPDRSAKSERSAPIKERPKLANRREEGKASLREKIGKLSENLQQRAAVGALTHDRGLEARKKGPTR